MAEFLCDCTLHAVQSHLFLAVLLKLCAWYLYAGMNDGRLQLDQPKGILKNEGSASKANRVVFSTPIAHKKSMPSDSDTSVFDLEVRESTGPRVLHS